MFLKLLLSAQVWEAFTNVAVGGDAVSHPSIFSQNRIQHL